jgi:hypothetical protein
MKCCARMDLAAEFMNSPGEFIRQKKEEPPSPQSHQPWD